MTATTRGVSQPIHRVLTELTHQIRLDNALSIAVKDWLRLKLKEVIDERHTFEQKYNMTFEEFKAKWHADQIPDRYSWEVERDYWYWEGAVTEENYLSFAYIQNDRRVFAVDNTGGWHRHPFHDPTLHEPLSKEATFAEFLAEVERHLIKPE